MPWAFKLCLAKVTGLSLLYMAVRLCVHGQSMLPRAVTRVGLLATFDSPKDELSERCIEGSGIFLIWADRPIIMNSVLEGLRRRRLDDIH